MQIIINTILRGVSRLRHNGQAEELRRQVRALQAMQYGSADLDAEFPLANGANGEKEVSATSKWTTPL